MKNKKRKIQMPRQPGHNRFYYPLEEKPISVTDLQAQQEHPYAPIGTELYSSGDPLGSYTGIPEDNDIPVQDADDL